MIIDLHSHTYYSSDSRDPINDLIEEMIKQGVDVLGITDHNYCIGERRKEYRNEIRSSAIKYSDKIKIYCGIEISTIIEDEIEKDYSNYDYCLIESLGKPNSLIKDDIITFARDFNCVKGIAHTDLFSFMSSKNLEPKAYLRELKENNFFWELNVNLDSIHKFREHQYVKEFFNNTIQQQLIKESGLCVSVGFDGHSFDEYKVDRVRQANIFLEENHIKNAIEIIKHK